jgi:hypothetical protein
LIPQALIERQTEERERGGEDGAQENGRGERAHAVERIDVQLKVELMRMVIKQKGIPARMGTIAGIEGKVVLRSET